MVVKRIDLRKVTSKELGKITPDQLPGLKLSGLRERDFREMSLDSPEALALRSQAVKILEFAESRLSVRSVFENEDSIPSGKSKKELEKLTGKEFTSAVSFFTDLRRVLVSAGAEADTVRKFEESVVDAMVEKLATPGEGRKFAEKFYDAMRSDSPDERRLATKAFEEGLIDESSFEASARALGNAIDFLGEKGVPALEAIERFVSGFDLNAPDVVDAWRKSHIYLGFGKTVARNIRVLRTLEAQRPGAAKVLQDEFGVMAFGRYTAKMLCRQYDDRNDTTKAYGVVILPRDDLLGMLYDDSEMLDNLSDELRQHNLLMRVVECASQRDLAKRFIRLDRRYGEKHKISFGIANTHGHEDAIAFGLGDHRQVLYKEDFLGVGVKRSRDFFTDDPVFIILSCRSGLRGKFAQKMADAFGAPVIASEQDTSNTEIHFRMEEGKPVFTVTGPAGVYFKTYQPDSSSEKSGGKRRS